MFPTTTKNQPKALPVTALAVREPTKFKRKVSTLLPAGLILLFGFWAFIVPMTTLSGMEPDEYDPRSQSLMIVQLSGLMLPLLLGACALSLSSIDRKNRMLTTLQSMGATPREIVLAKSLWVALVGVAGMLAIIIGTNLAGRVFGVETSGNHLVIAIFAAVLEIAALTPLFINLSLRLKQQGWVIAIALTGALVGSAGHMIPQNAAVLTPFTIIGGLSPVGVTVDELLTNTISLSQIGIAFVVALAVSAGSIGILPRRFSNEY